MNYIVMLLQFRIQTIHVYSSDKQKSKVISIQNLLNRSISGQFIYNEFIRVAKIVFYSSSLRVRLLSQ